MSEQLLTTDEIEAMQITAALANSLARIVGWGPTRSADLEELLGKVHDVQHAILAQAAARAYPRDFRLLGEILR